MFLVLCPVQNWQYLGGSANNNSYNRPMLFIKCSLCSVDKEMDKKGDK